MKNSIKFLLAFFIISTVFIGCKKDKEENNNSSTIDVTNTNHFMYDSSKYYINECILEYYGEHDFGIYNFDITLVTDLNEGLYFELMTADSTMLEVGDYTYINDTIEPKTITSSSVYTYNAEGDGLEYDITDVTVTIIATTATTIELSLECVDELGTIITGTYKGAFVYSDYSNKKSKKKKTFSKL